MLLFASTSDLAQVITSSAGAVSVLGSPAAGGTAEILTG